MRRVLPLLGAAGLALAAAAPAQATPDGPDANGSPLDLAEATLRQDGRSLVFTVRTRGDWASRVMTSRPGRSLCLIIFQRGRRFVCASATNNGRPALTLTRAGGPTSGLSADIDRANLRTLVVRFTAGAVDLRDGAFRWTVTSTWTDSRRCAARPCGDRLPNEGEIAARLLPPTPTGCAARGASYRTSGPGGRRAMALTFDDGPGPYTSQVLNVLKRTAAKGTFFAIGQQVGGGAGLMRRALREGHALANHSWNHASLSGGGFGQLSSTNAAIRRATGYTPCLFRAPYGAVSGTLIGQARSLGMLTIQWDVDPRDWSRPGTGAIMASGPAQAANVLRNAHPGAIVVMHDGGGPRSQTVAALPGMIATLKRRGYRLVTVPELLGLRPKYG
jgi:peptidoglycan/xylan/chitin deacetylase (PgdA/CDA1 family)